MFVRNNTLCPTCGKSRTFDVSFSQSLLGGRSSVKAECFHCLAVFRGLISLEHVRYVLRATVQQCPSLPGSQFISRWLPDVYLSLTKSQAHAVLRVMATSFEEGAIHGELLTRDVLQLNALIGWLIADRVQAGRFNAVESLFRSRLHGQSLAN